MIVPVRFRRGRKSTVAAKGRVRIKARLRLLLGFGEVHESISWDVGMEGWVPGRVFMNE